jgi:hypothetical protein
MFTSEAVRQRDRRRAAISQHYPTHAILQNGAVEIQQKSSVKPAKLEICQDLRFVDRHKPLNRLELQDHLLFDDDVDPITTIESDCPDITGSGT